MGRRRGDGMQKDGEKMKRMGRWGEEGEMADRVNYRGSEESAPRADLPTTPSHHLLIVICFHHHLLSLSSVSYHDRHNKKFIKND